MVIGDSRARVEKIAATIPDLRVQHFYDVHKLAGRAVARALGSDGKIAWDTYLFFDKTSGWNDSPPLPAEWMHQLGDPWADPAHYHGGDDLVAQLHHCMIRLFG